MSIIEEEIPEEENIRTQQIEKENEKKKEEINKNDQIIDENNQINDENNQIIDEIEPIGNHNREKGICQESSIKESTINYYFEEETNQKDDQNENKEVNDASKNQRISNESKNNKEGENYYQGVENQVIEENPDYNHEESVKEEDGELIEFNRKVDKQNEYLEEIVEDDKETKNRNEVINEYIEKLDKVDIRQNYNNNNNIYEEKNEQEEDDFDEFEKAEATYKKSISNQKEKEQVFGEYKQNYIDSISGKRLNYQYSSEYFLQKPLSPPGDLYRKENEYIKKLQLYRKHKFRILEPLNSKNHDLAINYNHQHKNFSCEKMNNEKQEYTSSNEISIPKLDGNIKRIPNKLLKKDRSPPSHIQPPSLYSNIWTNNMLKKSYNSKLEVEGTINGIPRYRVQKLKKHSCYIFVLFIN